MRWHYNVVDHPPASWGDHLVICRYFKWLFYSRHRGPCHPSLVWWVLTRGRIEIDCSLQSSGKFLSRKNAQNIYLSMHVNSCLLRVFCCYVGACIDMTPPQCWWLAGWWRRAWARYPLSPVPVVSVVLASTQSCPDSRPGHREPPSCGTLTTRCCGQWRSSDVNTREQDTHCNFWHGSPLSPQ